MGSFSIWHWIVVLCIVILIFGTKKVKSLGHDLGVAIKSFKDALNGTSSQDEANKSSKTSDSTQN